MHTDPSFLSLAVVAFLAVVVPLVLLRFRRLRLPIVVGEIVAGILVGRSGLGWVQEHDPVLDLLSHFGLVFLMFLSGMEIDFSMLGRSRGGPRGAPNGGPMQLGIASFAVTLLLSGAIGLTLQRLGLVRDAVIMALILSTTSLGVVMPVLKERGLLSGLFGQSVLIAALIADFVTMLLITVAVAVLSSGLTLNILLVGVLFVAFFLLYYFGTFLRAMPRVSRAIDELSHASAQIKVRVAFALMLMFVVLSEILGTEVILGAFLGGAIVALLRTPEDAELAHKLEAIGFGFFIPIFFVVVGVDFNLAALLASSEAVLLVPVLLLAAIALKVLPALLFRRLFTWRETLAAGALLSARLSLIIAAAAIGRQLGVISEPVNAAIILVAVLTVTAAPLAFNRLLPERPAEVRPVLVIGANEMGLQVAEGLRGHHEPVVIMDFDQARLERGRQRGLEVVLARVTQPDPAAEPYFNKAQAVVCTYDDTNLSYQVCELAHKRYGITRIVAQVNDPTQIARFEHLGVTTAHAVLDRAALLVMLVRNPAVFDLVTRTDDDKEVLEVALSHSQYVGQSLQQISLPGDVLVLALRRDGELVVPHGNTRLNLGDHLTLVGSIDAVESARRMLADGSLP